VSAAEKLEEAAAPVLRQRTLRRLSVSGASTYRRCPKEYKLSRELESILKASPLAFGSCMHAGLDPWFRTANLDSALAAIQAYARKHDLDPYDLVACEVLMVGYHERWIDEPLTVLFVEQEFTAPLTNPDTGHDSKTWEQYGRFDAVVKDQFERVWVAEHKTRGGDLDDPLYWQKMRLDAQISTYHGGVRSLGVEPAGVLYDVIRKPPKPAKATPMDKRKYTQQKDKACPECKKKSAPPGPHRIDVSGKDEPERFALCSDSRVITDPGGKLYANMREHDETLTEYRERVIELVTKDPNAFYRRAHIERSEEDEREAARDIWQQAQTMREAQKLNRYPRNPDACVRFGDTCPFFPICTREVTDPLSSGLYKLRTKN
jgi:PD-(D/E)XK nuclease superfamily